MSAFKYRKSIMLLLIMLILAFLLFNVFHYMDSDAKSSAKFEREKVMRYAVMCYALEGHYPVNIDYLVENYGLYLNEKNYMYFYDAFSSNLRPDIVVTKKKK